MDEWMNGMDEWMGNGLMSFNFSDIIMCVQIDELEIEEWGWVKIVWRRILFLQILPKLNSCTMDTWTDVHTDFEIN